MKRSAAVILCLAAAICLLGSCRDIGAASGFDASKSITVISREEGSGTRNAFVELTGILERDADGNKTDNTYPEAQVIDATQTVISTVIGNPYSIGYISLGSLNNTVKAVKIGGVPPAADTVGDGSYILSRPFNIAVRDDLSETARDFIGFILSTEGQAVVAGEGYASVSGMSAYSTSKPSGRAVVAGSSSVAPVMEKLKEAYLLINPYAEIEVQATDSSSGLSAAAAGICDIGMASRELKASEAAVLTPVRIAMDGIAVIVSNSNPVENLTLGQIRDIFTGAVTLWNEVIGQNP